ncbi:hypothetical protein [Macrococcus capreoli]|uniref:hypothetical protein n=1 Tax=Macrococcus capreoli TaxID=2982690 RepID=UPI003F428B49
MKRNITFTLLYAILVVILYSLIKDSNTLKHDFIEDYKNFTTFYIIFGCLPYIVFNVFYKKNGGVLEIEKNFYWNTIILSALMSIILMLLAAFIVLPVAQGYSIYYSRQSVTWNINNITLTYLNIILFLLPLALILYQLYTLRKSFLNSVDILKTDKTIDKRMDKFFKLGLKVITLMVTIITILCLLIMQQKKIDITYLGIPWGMSLAFLYIELFLYNKKTFVTFFKLIKPNF